MYTRPLLLHYVESLVHSCSLCMSEGGYLVWNAKAENIWQTLSIHGRWRKLSGLLFLAHFPLFGYFFVVLNFSFVWLNNSSLANYIFLQSRFSFFDFFASRAMYFFVIVYFLFLSLELFFFPLLFSPTLLNETCLSIFMQVSDFLFRIENKLIRVTITTKKGMFLWILSISTHHYPGPRGLLW